VGGEGVRVGARFSLVPERLDDRPRSLAARKVLLPGDQVAIANGETAPRPGLHIVGPELLQLVLDAPRHHVLVARERAHLPHRVVGVILLHICKARYRLPFCQILVIRELCVSQDGYAVTKGGRHFPGLVELGELALKFGLPVVGEHRTLPAGYHNRVKGFDTERRYRPGALDELGQIRDRLEAHGDQVARRVAAWIERVAHRISLAFPAFWAEDLDLVATLD